MDSRTRSSIKNIISIVTFHVTLDSNLGHGSYLVSSNGFTWSHSEKSDNIIDKKFTFSEGDTIELTLKENSLEFKKRKDGSTLTLKTAIKSIEWKEVCFVVNLCSLDDCV